MDTSFSIVPVLNQEESTKFALHCVTLSFSYTDYHNACVKQKQSMITLPVYQLINKLFNAEIKHAESHR